MQKRMKIMIIALVIVFGAIFGWNLLRAYFMRRYFANFQPPPVTISAQKAERQTWQPFIEAIGTVAAINGVSVSTEADGIIKIINFNSGQMVKKGDLLIKIDDSVEQAELQNNKAALILAEQNLTRISTLYKSRVEPKAQLDQAAATYQQAIATLNKTQAQINQKTITAPFDGKIGIRQVNIGQYVSAGTQMVSLQSMDPLYVNFSVPEQYLNSLFIGQPVQIHVDPYPNQTFTGKLTAINSTVNTQTHNIQLQATFSNKELKLYPGLFGSIKVGLHKEESVVTVPQTAIAYSLFGNAVYVVQKTGTDKDNKPILRITRRFVKLGEQRDNKIVILSGIKAGEMVVTSGQLKIDNGTQVLINNKIQP